MDAQGRGCSGQWVLGKGMLRTVDARRKVLPGMVGAPYRGWVPRTGGASYRGCRCIRWGPLAAHPSLG